ncbi:MAG: prephenate dehydrogenase/arogenate dehydrogenase family protein [Candidatus Gracilibacteria bacterium]|nr:prephenate dehydrogenase/arogenate dehydrogenase family protein [Candidatus Gracilibacteria bacterium]
MKQNITIIGGTDGFGKWTAEFLLKHFGSDISLTITGRNTEKGEKLISLFKREYPKGERLFSTNNIESVKNADITVFAVPIAFMEESIKNIAPHLKQNSVVLDVCSIKEFSSIALKKYSPKGVLIIPTHPMFGPFISSIAGQIFVLTSEEKDRLDFRYKFLVDFLNKNNAKVLETSAKEHDKMMAVVQGLTHYDIFVFAETMKRLGVDIKKSLDFVSPIYKLKLSSVARYMSQNPKLYGDIQMYNKEILNVHKTFMEVSSNFNKIVENKDEANFIKIIEETKKYFGDNAQKGQVYTDKLIYLISKQIDLVKNNIGKSINFENIYTQKVINKKINSYKNETIYLENGEKLFLDEWRVFE